MAPDFVGTDSNGKNIALKDLRGRIVVLEWSNNQSRCGQALPLREHASAAEGVDQKGIVWLTILSNAPGEQGNVSAAEANALTSSRGAAPSAVILDPSGIIGRLTAHAPRHTCRHRQDRHIGLHGGIDDKPTTDVADIATAKNYVRLALTAVTPARRCRTRSRGRTGARQIPIGMHVWFDR